MPLIPHTPESLLPRSDSKNPATTCKGLTSNGRPCRRGLASSPGASPTPNRGVLAVLTEEDIEGGRAAAFFCWQHKDQAENLVSATSNATEVVQLKERTSIDTLVERLGVLDLDNETTPTRDKRHKRRKEHGKRPSRRDTLPEQWHDVQGPLMSVPEDMLPSRHRPDKHRNKKPRPKSNVVPSMFCCLKPADDEDFPPPRRRPDHQGRPSAANRPSNMTQLPTRSHLPPGHDRQHPNSQIDRILVPHTPPRRPPIPPSSPSSHTSNLLSLIPQHLSPQTTSSLLTELAKPISPADEAGYIYMFWLTASSSASPPAADIASSLLAAPHDTHRTRRASDALRSNSTTRNANGKNTILLKIGRASNVHRRLTQWTKQCSHDLTLIRYYPYQPSSPGASPGPSPGPSPRSRNSQSLSPQPSDEGPRKVPHVHRVERLIHIELSDKRVKAMGKCDECGKEHREWFEVEASTAGLREVDGCVRRWVGWAEQQPGPARSEAQAEGYF
jgi:hypothetical protein